ncbi:MAG: hypothetical protein WCG34_10965, partial [Leptolinea sp.]
LSLGCASIPKTKNGFGLRVAVFILPSQNPNEQSHLPPFPSLELGEGRRWGLGEKTNPCKSSSVQ